MSQPMLDAVLGLRSVSVRRGLREHHRDRRVQEGVGHPVRSVGEGARAAREFLDRGRSRTEGLDAATRDFVAGMTDRYAVRLFEQLFIPKPWSIE